MRPLQLELEGFGSFREATTISFEDTELFALSGPTGAGKSTIIDGMIFALYGSVPRLDDKRLVHAIISHGLNEARVRLTFESRGHAMTVTRVVRRQRNGGATTKEARLEHADGRPIVSGRADVDEAVVRMVGLSFEHFVRCVVLPQGAFQEFLHAKPTERQQLLGSLLDLGVYDRLAKRARERAEAAKAQVTASTAALEGPLSLATPDAVNAAKSRIATLSDLLAQFEREQEELDDLRAQGSTVKTRIEELGARRDTAAGLAVPSGVDDLDGRLTVLAADVAARTTALQEAGAHVATANAAITELPDAVQVSEQAARVRDVARVTSEVDQLTARQANDATTLVELQQIAKHAVTDRDAAVQARVAAELAGHVTIVAESLEIGAPCPVCTQEVHTLPDHPTDPELQRLRLAEQHADNAAQQAEGQLRRAEAAAEQVKEQHRAVAERHATLVAAVATAGAELSLPTDVVALDAIADRLRSANTDLAKARQAEAAARTKLDQAKERQAAVGQERREAWTVLERARDAVAVLDPPPIDREVGLAASWADLATHARDGLPKLDALIAAATKERLDLAERWKALLAAQRAALGELGVTAPEKTTPLNAVVAAHATESTKLERLEIDLVEARRHQELLVSSRARHRVAHELGLQLSNRNFQGWLLHRALRRVLVGATEILQELSRGVYSLALDDKNAFEVIDHANADERRLIRTLSGGETFLASLALALALSEQVAALATGGTARLETLFIDEGFGTLDAETLDVVASALNEIASRGRMVGLVTHVPALSEQVPTQYRVTKVGNASSVERVSS